MIRIAIFSDGHYGIDGTSGVSYTDRHNKMVERINNEHTRKPLNFVVYNGDLVNNVPNQLTNVKNILDNLDMPYFVNYGNHDEMDFSSWKTLWGLNTMDYHFEVNNVGFVMLNSGEPDYEDVGYGAGYRLPDASFLQNACETYTSVGKDVIVFCHIRLDHTNYGGNSDGVFSTETQVMHNYLKNNPKVRAVIHSHGHGSDYIRNYDGQYYFWTGHFSHRWERALPYFGYRIIEIDDFSVMRTYYVNITNNYLMNDIVSESFVELQPIVDSKNNIFKIKEVDELKQTKVFKSIKNF